MAARNNSPNWEAIKADYLIGGISQQKLADKHGIPRSTLQLRIKREGWRELREAVSQKAEEKLADRAAKIQADTLAQLMEMRAQAAIDAYRKVIENIKKHPDGAGTKTIRETVKVKVVKLDNGEEKKVPLKSSYVSDIEASVRTMSIIDRMFGMDAASELSHERFELQKQQRGAIDDAETFNANMLSIAELINHPMPDRTMEQIEAPEDGDGT